MPTKINKVYLPDVVGGGYGDFWRFKGRYRVVKGSRASKKSKTTALWYIWNIVKYPGANLLVVRMTERTLRDSCFADLKWAIHRLQLDPWFKTTTNPLSITYIPTGQKILFRGLDNPLKVTSITVDTGILCWLWCEEAYELMKEDDFDMLDESIRGTIPDEYAGLFKQITLTLNPWSDRHWIKRRFFDAPTSDNILAKTTNYLCNEWLDDADRRVFDDMKKNNPKRYKVAGLGEWGVTEGIIFNNWEVADLTDMIPRFSNVYNGLDFGFAADPNAFIRFDYEHAQKKIYVFDEMYKTGMQNDELAAEIKNRISPYDYVTCDSADPKTIDYLNRCGIRAVPSVKGPDSINFGIDWLQQYTIVIHKDCTHFQDEIANYAWQKDKFGSLLQKPIDENNHLIDALRYGSEPLQFQSRASAGKRL